MSKEKTIGAIVCWSLNGYLAPRNAFRDALASAWPDAEVALSKLPGPRVALRSAVAKIGTRYGAILRPFGSGVSSGFAVILEAKGSDGALQHDHVANIRANDGGPRIEHLGKANKTAVEIFAAVRDAWFERRDNVDSEELSMVLSGLMVGAPSSPLLGAFNLRERTGGVYYVPTVMLDKLFVVKSVIALQSSGCRISVLALANTESNRVEMALEAHSYLERELGEVRAESMAFVAELRASCRRATRHNLRTRERRFDGLIWRANAYRDILGAAAVKLYSEITRDKDAAISAIKEVL